VPTILSAATPWRDRFEFDTPRFESSQPSQPPRSLASDSAHSAKTRHFRGLAARSLVSGKKFRAPRGGCWRSRRSLTEPHAPRQPSSPTPGESGIVMFQNVDADMAFAVSLPALLANFFLALWD
jgi:hypothetical protein